MDIDGFRWIYICVCGNIFRWIYIYRERDGYRYIYIYGHIYIVYVDMDVTYKGREGS